MYETMMTRHTTMVVGPTGGGKSVVINTLCQAQTRSLSLKYQHGHFSIAHLMSKRCVLYIVSRTGWG